MSYPVTPILSVEAVQLKSTEVSVILEEAKLVGIVGASVSVISPSIVWLPK